MAQCDQCGNSYDKSFEVSLEGETYTSTASNVPSRSWRPHVRIAGAASSGTASSRMTWSIAAPTAPKSPERPASATGP